MFQLTFSEVEFLVSQNAIPSKKHPGGCLPYAFTGQGATNLSGEEVKMNLNKIGLEI